MWRKYCKKAWSCQGHKTYLHHIVLGHQHRLLLLQAIRAALAPNLGPLDPGGLVGGAWTQGEETWEQDGFGQLLADGLMGHFAHVHHCVSADHTCTEEGKKENVHVSLMLKTVLQQKVVCPLVKRKEQRLEEPV